MERQVLTEHFKNAKAYIKGGDENKARDEADLGILNILVKRENGLKDGSMLEGLSLDQWITRFWVFLEKHNLMLE